MTAREVLVAAKLCIMEYGWVQGRMGSRSVGFCVAGALDHVAPRTVDFDAAYRGARDCINRLVGDAPTWNDTPFRTKAHVLALFDRAIEACGE